MTDVKYKNILPFAALVGQDTLKMALMLNVINPKLGGLLLRGEKGTGKSTAVRALAHLLPEIDVIKDCPYSCDPTDVENMCDLCRKKVLSGEKLTTERRKIRVINLPLGVTEDRLLGTLDIERALKEGIKALEPGLLAHANRGILYVDEVNLLDDTIADILLDSAAMGVNVIEREGLSLYHPARFTLIASMNPEEGELRSQLLDRFGLYVEVKSITDRDERYKIASLVNKFETSPDRLRSLYAFLQEELANRMESGRKALPAVCITESLVEFCAYLVSSLNIKTHRAEVNLVRAARAIAAYNNARLNVTIDDVKEAANLVLPHRTQVKSFEEPYLDKALLKSKMAEVQQVLGLSSLRETIRPDKEEEKEDILHSFSDIPEVEEGEIFKVGDFYSSKPWDKLHQKKK
jgi:magnesium chelatase subunit D